MTAEVLADQGGWDELLFVLLPLGLFVFLLVMANKRAGRYDEDDDDESSDDA